MRIERIGNATLYLGDCLTVLPEIRADVVITDPPYGISFFHSGKGGGSGPSTLERGTRPPKTKFAGREAMTHGDDKPFDPAPLLALGLPMILWGANHYASRLPDSGGWIVWDKRTFGAERINSFSDAELAWCSYGKAVRTFRHVWMGGIRAGEECGGMGSDYKREHPAQKPERLMRFCIEHLGEGGSVLDPYMGSGTTGVAAAKLGRSFIGVEIEPKFFDIACERIENAQRQERLFA